MICVTDFWISFWPNLASTIVGIVIGLPLAILTNRLIVREGTKKQAAEQSNRLQVAFGIIKQTLAENRARLASLRDSINSSKVRLDEGGLDTSAWNAIKMDIINYSHDHLLLKKIAYHFSRLSSFMDLHRMYRDMAIGVASVIGGVDKQRTVLKVYILSQIDDLIRESDEISTLIKNNTKKVDITVATTAPSEQSA